MAKKHTILGAGGVIGRTLADALRAKGIEPRLVDRATSPDRPGQVAADLLDPADARRVTEGTDVVHFTVGLPYDNTIWEEQFPAIMRNLVSALKGSSTRLVFMDNVYMYGKVDGPQNEDAPHAAKTRKGLARKNMVDQLAASDVDYVIARSADFYGPGANTTSLLNLFVLANLKAGKPVAWLGGVDLPHAFTFTRDIASAMVALADASDVRGTTWHVPTAPARTIRELSGVAAGLLQTAEPEFQVLDLPTVEQYAKGDAVMNATVEMFYQFDSPYLFDSSRFESRFGAKPTSLETGIREAIAALG